MCVRRLEKADASRLVNVVKLLRGSDRKSFAIPKA